MISFSGKPKRKSPACMENPNPFLELSTRCIRFVGNVFEQNNILVMCHNAKNKTQLGETWALFG